LSRLRRKRDLALQLFGFVAGILLIVWCARRAIAGDGIEEIRSRLAAASPLLIGGLLASTLVSLLANGALFWNLIRPVHPLSLAEMQLVNGMASFLNYAPLPFRLGLIARITYHWRVNELSLRFIAGWLAAALACTLVALAATAASLPLAPRGGLLLVAASTLVLTLVGVVFARWFVRLPFVTRRLKGGEAMVASPIAFGGAAAFRLIDMAAWALRMVLAAKLLGVPISTEQSALLGLAAVVASMNPLGRFGFREAAVAWFASTLFAGTMSAEELSTTFARLALVESAAEGAITIPLGGAAALWCWKRISSARQPTAA